MRERRICFRRVASHSRPSDPICAAPRREDTLQEFGFVRFLGWPMLDDEHGTRRYVTTSSEGSILASASRLDRFTQASIDAGNICPPAKGIFGARRELMDSRRVDKLCRPLPRQLAQRNASVELQSSSQFIADFRKAKRLTENSPLPTDACVSHGNSLRKVHAHIRQRRTLLFHPEERFIFRGRRSDNKHLAKINLLFFRRRLRFRAARMHASRL